MGVSLQLLSLISKIINLIDALIMRFSNLALADHESGKRKVSIVEDDKRELREVDYDITDSQMCDPSSTAVKLEPAFQGMLGLKLQTLLNLFSRLDAGMSLGTFIFHVMRSLTYKSKRLTSPPAHVDHMVACKPKRITHNVQVISITYHQLEFKGNSLIPVCLNASSTSDQLDPGGRLAQCTWSFQVRTEPFFKSIIIKREHNHIELKIVNQR